MSDEHAWKRQLVLAASVLVAMGWCVHQSSDHREFTPETRRRGCLANQNSIDKMVGVWESQNVGIRNAGDLWIELRTDGTIGRISKDLAAGLAQQPRVPRGQELEPGSRALFNYVKDPNLFICPSRWREAPPGADLSKLREASYRWVMGKQPDPALGGRTRGTICLAHGEVGEADAETLRHRLD